MARFIAFYLPQYHPIKENDDWYGKGFTEWTNVARAKKLFIGHKQPHVPADLGFYDLRVPEVREQQAELAKEAGIEGFLYWHYWFGNGKQLLERPFNEVVSSGKPDFPFCLGWANHSWYKKKWDPKAKDKDVLIMEQKYQGRDDYINHFNSLLPAFRDHRYITVNGKLLFLIYDVLNFPEVDVFIDLWQELAKENGLNGFYFISRDTDCRFKDEIMKHKVDAVYNADTLNAHHHSNIIQKIWWLFTRTVFHLPTRIKYKRAIKYMVTDDCRKKDVIPSISPNWDHSPRSGGNAVILVGSKPSYFEKVAKRAIDVVSEKPEQEQIVFVSSWNEWAEGNYMEPDLEFGKGYIEALRKAIESSK